MTKRFSRIRTWQSLTARLVMAAFGLACALACTSGTASAQIDRAGHHPHYSVELEPDLNWQWTGDEAAFDDGVGIGFRVAIPVLKDGPVPSINNNLAITFGMQWAHFGNACGPRPDRCDEDDIWVPITVQWNFFLTDMISIFPEFGLGFRDALFDYDICNNRVCRGSDLEVHPVMWFGARFRLHENVALTLRLGTPMLQFGVSFLI
jgi:hypothetical protein